MKHLFIFFWLFGLWPSLSFKASRYVRLCESCETCSNFPKHPIAVLTSTNPFHETLFLRWNVKHYRKYKSQKKNSTLRFRHLHSAVHNFQGVQALPKAKTLKPLWFFKPLSLRIIEAKLDQMEEMIWKALFMISKVQVAFRCHIFREAALLLWPLAEHAVQRFSELQPTGWQPLGAADREAFLDDGVLGRQVPSKGICRAMEFCGLCGLAAKNEKESNVLSKVNDAEIEHYTSWRHYRQVMEDGGLTGVIGKSLVPLGWYPSCLTLQGALQKGIYPTNTHYIRCIWGWRLRVPSQEVPPFSLWRRHERGASSSSVQSDLDAEFDHELYAGVAAEASALWTRESEDSNFQNAVGRRRCWSGARRAFDHFNLATFFQTPLRGNCRMHLAAKNPHTLLAVAIALDILALGRWFAHICTYQRIHFLDLFSHAAVFAVFALAMRGDEQHHSNDTHLTYKFFQREMYRNGATLSPGPNHFQPTNFHHRKHLFSVEHRHGEGVAPQITRRSGR